MDVVDKATCVAADSMTGMPPPKSGLRVVEEASRVVMADVQAE